MFERLWTLRWKSPSSRFVFVVELKQETLTSGRLRERCKDWMLPSRPQDRDISNYDVQRTTCILLIFINGCAIIKLWNLQNCLASGEIYVHDMHYYDKLVMSYWHSCCLFETTTHLLFPMLYPFLWVFDKTPFLCRVTLRKRTMLCWNLFTTEL